ncbi:hypothetical protein L915_10450 [Phytophthora nicotianae]|uniref:Uncharacterized protein n=1 Tax=Phytophthora nicotianae TaxID=4792 RepID=W2IV89_PHYNI|nr:hypothetical protein L915_10450 [Phytophthora nicotianae]ETL38036.1 hypothetical protein L916_10343 [Phytophthora nicotianae]
MKIGVINANKYMKVSIKDAHNAIILRKLKKWINDRVF